MKKNFNWKIALVVFIILVVVGGLYWYRKATQISTVSYVAPSPIPPDTSGGSNSAPSSLSPAVSSNPGGNSNPSTTTISINPLPSPTTVEFSPTPIPPLSPSVTP